LLLLGSCAHPQASAEVSAAVFKTKVKPVLEYYCIECHDVKSAGKYGGLILETGTTAMQTGRHAPVIRPGRPDDSLLYTVLRLGHEEALGMPPSPDKISDEQLEGIRQWIRAGAHWPQGEQGRLKLPAH
jgi:mono/diheme cytochrome c family protein